MKDLSLKMREIERRTRVVSVYQNENLIVDIVFELLNDNVSTIDLSAKRVIKSEDGQYEQSAGWARMSETGQRTFDVMQQEDVAQLVTLFNTLIVQISSKK